MHLQVIHLQIIQVYDYTYKDTDTRLYDYRYTSKKYEQIAIVY